MTKLRYLHYTQLGIFLLLRSTLVGGEGGQEGCLPPSVPVASTYLNVTKGLNKSSWKIKYLCDKGKISNIIFHNFLYYIIICMFKLNNYKKTKSYQFRRLTAFHKDFVVAGSEFHSF